MTQAEEQHMDKLEITVACQRGTIEELRKQIAALREQMACAKTPLMADVLKERDMLRSQLAEKDEYHNAYVEDTKENYAECHKWLTTLRAENERLREGLRKLEWVSSITGSLYCSVCRKGKYDDSTPTHKPDCWLSKLLED